MESNLSRNSERAERVRLDDVVVEFTAGSADECFEADAINVSPGGIALRSPLLPEVGTRLACRFSNPLDGELIRAECEVVWASDHGPNLGEFGLRFERLSAESAESLRRLVEDDDRLLTREEAEELGWSAPPEVASESDDGGPEVIALELEGVGSELLAEVKHDSDDALVAEQELPFLRLGTRVTTEFGRVGVLQTVELRVDGDLPRLVFTIVYDAPAKTDVEAIDDASDEFDSRRALSLDEPGDEIDDGIDEPAIASAEADDDGDSVDEGDGDEYASFDGGSEHDSLDDDTIPDDLHAPVSIRQARPRISEHVRAVGEPVVGRASEVAGAMRDATVDRLSSALPAVRSKFDDARESMTAVANDVGPRVRDGAREFAARASRFTKLLGQKLRAEAAIEANPKKRVQRRPDDRVATADAPIDRRFRGRHLLIGALGLTVAVLAIRGIVVATGDDAPATPVVPAAAAEESFEDTQAQVAETASAVAPVAVAPAPEPMAPAVVGGPIPAPTYPTLDRASDSASAASEAPASRPRLDFGAASVPGATPFELRMTTPIDRIEGEATESGFTVRIFRSNSLSRAGPIAQQHPSVDRAAVTNDGENAILTIGWKPGRRPAYRVEAVGSRLRILLGR